MSFEVTQHAWTYTQDPISLFTIGFGPCHVLTGYHENTQTKLLAHIDDTSSVESIQSIFKTLQEEQSEINLSEMKVSLSGGWPNHPESERWAKHILKILLDYKIMPDMTSWRKKKICLLETNEDFKKAGIGESQKRYIQSIVSRQLLPHVAFQVNENTDFYERLSLNQDGVITQIPASTGIKRIDFFKYLSEEESSQDTSPLIRL